MQALLLRLFFSTIYILCPVVSPRQIKSLIRACEHPSGEDDITRLVGQAMMFASFPHLKPADFSRTDFDDIRTGQAYLFGQVKQRFARVEQSLDGSTELVQVALLLSFWSPYDASTEVNTFWARTAVHYATRANIDQSEIPSEFLLWWCCVVRSRTLALGLRRPQKLAAVATPPLPNAHHFKHLISTDKGKPSPQQICAARAFVAICKLAAILEYVGIVNNPNMSWNPWRAPKTVDTYTDTYVKLSQVEGWLDELGLEVCLIMRQSSTDSPGPQFRAALLCLRVMIQ